MAEKKIETRAIGNMKYEEAAAELEKIVGQLEEGQLSLEETLVLYERGQLLSKHCTELLNQAELKIRTLTGDTQPNIQVPEK
jgi:exodeoxyribonuclease VII small subunit